MGVVIESEVWEPNKPLYIFIFVSCLISIYFSPHNKNRTATAFDYSLSSAFLRFQRSFLLLFSLSSGEFDIPCLCVCFFFFSLSNVFLAVYLIMLFLLFGFDG